LDSQMKTTGSRVKTLQKSIFKNQARLAALPAAKKFLEELHEKASVNFTIIAVEADKDPLILVRGGKMP